MSKSRQSVTPPPRQPAVAADDVFAASAPASASAAPSRPATDKSAGQAAESRAESRAKAEAEAQAAEDEARAKAETAKAGPRVFVCTEETFWRNRLWRVGERTGDLQAEGRCFREE